MNCFYTVYNSGTMFSTYIRGTLQIKSVFRPSSTGVKRPDKPPSRLTLSTVWARPDHTRVYSGPAQIIPEA